MNTCIVCGGSFQPQSNCPYCNFPEITVLGDKAVLDEMAAGYRKDYLADIRLGVMYTMWKADGDTLTADRASSSRTALPSRERIFGATVNWRASRMATGSTSAWWWKRPASAGSSRCPYPT